MFHSRLLIAGGFVAMFVLASPRLPAADPAGDADFAIQGEYVGDATKEGKATHWGAQVIALGGGKFQAVGYPGGLPGDGWNEKTKKRADGELKEGVGVFTTEDKDTLRIHDGKLEVFLPGGEKIGELKRVERTSCTMGAKPPEGAKVLYAGPDSVGNWEKGRADDEGLLMQGVTSKEKFKNFSLHIEFRLPYMPKARGQERGNSGCYLQGRYEVQMLDSFGLEGEENECGGVYSISKPRLNMCYPPLAWQTYDVEFTAAEYQDGKKVKNGRMTVKHNGVLIHENLELTHGTTANPVPEGPDPGPIYLQNHGSDVRYRNVWIVPKD